MDKVDGIVFVNTVTEYHQNFEKYSQLRFGQFLMNKLLPEVSDPEIYYEEDKDKAFLLFQERYVDYSFEEDLVGEES